MKFAIKWEIKDETVLQLAYYKLKAFKNGILNLDEKSDPIEQAVEVLLYQDYWNEAFGMVAVQFCDIGLVMCGYNDNW